MMFLGNWLGLADFFFFFSLNNISYAPMLTVEGESIKVADPKSRENCLEGYTFLLEETNMVIF